MHAKDVAITDKAQILHFIIFTIYFLIYNQ
jgi:hypothetical protein